MFRGLQFFVTCLVAAGVALPVMVEAQDPTKELKTIATAKDNARTPSFGPFWIKRPGVVIRSAEELVALTNKATSSKDVTVQKAMEAELAKILKVDAIDFSKHMVLGVISTDFESLKSDGKVLTATYIHYNEPITRAIPPTPKVLVLIERVEGEVKFVSKKTK